tara:strand:- start:3933 stop:4460 length:528 start_codon:yes stop_codon:yes gene_type:complete
MDKNRIITIILIISIIINSGVIAYCGVEIFKIYQIHEEFISGSIEYNNSKIFEKIKPRFVENIDFYYTTEKIFNITGEGKNYVGMYASLFNSIKLNVNETYLRQNHFTLEKIYCHEICHYIWDEEMNSSTRKMWEDKYDSLSQKLKTYYSRKEIINANELHSNWCEDNLGVCFIE